MLISPVVLARLLTVAEFGSYREFLLYVTVLFPIATLGINSSLLYFVAANPASTWRFVNQSIVFVTANSVLSIGAVLAIDWLANGALLGPYALAVVIYTLLLVNLDFWEPLWLAQKRPTAVMAYTLTRLIVRLVAVVLAAAWSASVTFIIWLLVALEAFRVAASAIGWRLVAGDPGPPLPASWRRQFQYCFPVGISLVLVTFGRFIGNIFIAKMMGPVALAHYTVGTYISPVVSTIRNSLSDALLPEMADQRDGALRRNLLLWQRTTVVFALLLMPTAVLLVRFAEPTILLLFPDSYRSAIPVFQIYALVLIRECLDYGVLVRALERTRILVAANVLSLAVNATLLFVLVPRYGLNGAISALVCARIFDGVYLTLRVAPMCGSSAVQLVPWSGMLRVAVAAGVPGLLLMYLDLKGRLGLSGVVLEALMYAPAYILLLWVMAVPEARGIAQRLVPAGLRIERKPG
jgi:O-antigen/teichoic acid export membrane protein